MLQTGRRQEQTLVVLQLLLLVVAGIAKAVVLWIEVCEKNRMQKMRSNRVSLALVEELGIELA